jgi:hypothetical protein
VNYETTPEGQTVNQDFYQLVLRHLPDVVQRNDLKCELWDAGSSIMIIHLLTQCCQLNNYW